MGNTSDAQNGFPEKSTLMFFFKISIIEIWKITE